MFFLPSRLEQVSISVPRLLYVSLWGLTSPLLERVEDVNALRKPRHAKHPVFRARVDSDLLDTSAHGRHPLPVVRLESLLHSVELEADTPSRLGWKRSNLVERGPQPEKRLIHSGLLYKY
jgi:hypothetical protein